eukprot:COSAG01_NODE_42073_length_443_cov_101.133721_1_plen_80_part_10
MLRLGQQRAACAFGAWLTAAKHVQAVQAEAEKLRAEHVLDTALVEDGLKGQLARVSLRQRIQRSLARSFAAWHDWSGRRV